MNVDDEFERVIQTNGRRIANETSVAANRQTARATEFVADVECRWRNHIHGCLINLLNGARFVKVRHYS